MFDIHNQPSDLWQQLELTSEIESNLTSKILWTGAAGGLLISMLEKFNLFHLTGLISGAIIVKIDESACEEKSSFKILGLSFFSKLN